MRRRLALMLLVAGCQQGSVGEPDPDARVEVPDASIDARVPFCGEDPGGDCCHDDDDCDPEDCRRPGEPPPCGAPNEEKGDCVIDEECDTEGGQICEPIPCSTIDARRCVAGCTGDGDCPTGEVCGAPIKRCFAQPCEGGCPTDFHCDESVCARDACVDDADCAGWCVEGVCHEQLGVCTPPAP